ncbi:tetratricopeptide repeat protein [Arenicella xantha]|uniref:Tetratricopeptide repeat protein n=1 Tax=Arenicella xantha TaxID=644221 RepID=A0A395JRX6_9GAMM|nr:glycosyltransferase family 41 protein [Arenicella xantha]RBP53335.1 tetratricopeptide repeat protein [Arenicella xantha]
MTTTPEQINELLSKAMVAMRNSQYQEAITLTNQILEHEKDHASAHAVKFSSLFKAQKFEQARQLGGRTAQLNPTSEFVLNNQACLQLEAKQPASAAGLLKSLIDQFGERSQWLYNLALAHRMVGNYDYAIITFRRTLDHQPDHDRAAFQLADCLSVIGHKEEAIRAYDYVRLLRSKHAPSHSNYICQAVNNNALTTEGLLQELRLWEDRFIPKDNRYTANSIQNPKQVRIGFLIGSLPENWLEATVAPVINKLASGNDSINVYWHDEKLREGLFNSAVTVVNSPGFSDADFARKVRNDNIEILIDVCGMRRGSRQRALGLQVAGKEFGWLAHEGRYATPLVKLLDDALGEYRFFVSAEYESFTARTKPISGKMLAGIGCQHGLSHSVIKVWAEVLRRLPEWQLHLDVSNKLVSKLLIERFAAHDIEPDRLSFDAKARPGKGTIVLDNFVQNDPVAAANAISHGAILVAVEGSLFPAKQSAGLLKQLGKADWLCDNQRDYRNRILALVNDGDEPIDQQAFNQSGVRDLNRFAARFRELIVTD